MIPPAIFEFFASLPRQGPGSDETTAKALALLGPLPARPRVVDFGCGSGAATRVLAERLPDATVLAVDISAILLERLRALDPAGRIEARVASMLEPGEPERFDLVWSEGAIDAVGVEAALRAWSPQLRPAGVVVFSALVWFEPARAPEAVEYWAAHHPAMRDEAGVREQVAALGFRLRFDFRLEPQAWLDYYASIALRCDELAGTRDPAMVELIAELRTEIAMYQRFGDSYGYAFFGLERA